jgi:hypothetical protein
LKAQGYSASTVLHAQVAVAEGAEAAMADAALLALREAD